MPRSVLVFLVFLRLGLTSFGGPIAHIGYFRTEFVERRGWLSDRQFGELVALCQFLPGPASSQVGFAVGLLRAGVPGAVLAFVAFTLPSALVMLAVALGAAALGGGPAEGAIRGLMLVAVAVVAQAVWSMARTLTPDRPRAGIAVVAALTVLVVGGPLSQIAALVVGAAAGAVWCRRVPASDTGVHTRFPLSRAVGAACLGLFAVLLVGLPAAVAVTGNGALALFDAFYRSGALVFGGGHVVLPLLDSAVVQSGWVGPDQFLTGYAAAQAVPGPLFTFATYLGALASAGPGGIAGAVLATVAIFLPGFLLLVGVLPFWSRVQGNAAAGAMMRGASAAVVGILAAALYDPVFVEAVSGPATFGLALAGFVALVVFRVPPWLLVLIGALGGAAAGAWWG
jgi:chromate transporter